MSKIRTFYLRNSAEDPVKCAIIRYDTEKRQFIDLTINPTIDIRSRMPIMIGVWALNNKYVLDAETTMSIIRERIEPPGRQNIREILDNAGLSSYDELGLLLAHRGRCCQDYAYVEEVPSNEIPSFD